MGKKRIRPNDEKLRELILLISEWSQADPRFDAIKLNKLLFHSDFSAYLTYGAPITGQEYFALGQGPAPSHLKSLTERMKEREELAWRDVNYYGHSRKRPVALRSPRLSVFSSAEVDLVRRIVQKFWKHGATEISDQSRLFLAWKIARGETIPYGTALVSRRKPTEDERRRGLTLQALAEEHLRARG